MLLRALDALLVAAAVFALVWGDIGLGLWVVTHDTLTLSMSLGLLTLALLASWLVYMGNR